MKLPVILSAVLACAAATALPAAPFTYSSVAPYNYRSYPYKGIHGYSAYPYTYRFHPYSAQFAAPVPAPVAAPFASAPYFDPNGYGALNTKSQHHTQDEFGQASFGHATHDQAHSAVRDAFGGVTGSYSYVNPEGKVITVHYTADAVHGFRVASNDLPVAPEVPEVPALVGPTPVKDTPEVVAAREEHLAAYAEARSRTRRQAIFTPLAYGHGRVLPSNASVYSTRTVHPVAYRGLPYAPVRSFYGYY